MCVERIYNGGFFLARFSSSPKRIYEVFIEYVNVGNKDKPVGECSHSSN